MEAKDGQIFTSIPWKGKTICDGVEVRDDGSGQGLGLYSTKWFQMGDEIFRDQPMAFLQNYSSSLFSPSCANCGCDVLGLEDALTWAVKGRCRSIGNYSGIHESGLLRCADLQMPCPVRCPHECGTLFCSDACRDRQLSVGHHRILCRNLLAPDSLVAWEDFCTHARRVHETFILAAYVIAESVVSINEGLATPHEAFARCAQFYSRRWHELVPESVTDREFGRRTKLEKLEESFELLNRALNLSICCGIVDLEFYDKLVGMFDLTCVDVGRSHCLEVDLKAKLDMLSGDMQADFWDVAAEWWISQEKVERECYEFGIGDDDDDEGLEKERSVLPPFEGLAFSRILALTNHSCFPNVLVEQETSCEIILKAQRAIPPGQQLMISYIELTASCVERQKKLLDEYCFRCLCVRCRGEAAYQILEGNHPPGLESLHAWLDKYAADHGLPLSEVAYDVWSNMPSELRLTQVDNTAEHHSDSDGSER